MALGTPTAMPAHPAQVYTMASSILTFPNQLRSHANIQKGQPKQILIYLFKSCLKFCKWNLNLFEVKPWVINTSLSMVGMCCTQCHCLGKYIDYSQTVFSVCKQPLCKSYETVLTYLHALTCHEIKNFLSLLTKLSWFLTAFSFKSAYYSEMDLF